MKKIVLVSMLLASCMAADQPKPDEHAEQAPTEEVWVCHNPESEQHNKECSESCYEADNFHVYCWLLHEEDCKTNIRLEWQRLACPLVEKNEY